MEQYQAYKDSGVAWIGEIPQEWNIKRIKYLATSESSLFTDGDWIESKDIVFDESQIRYITTGNIGEGRYKEQGLTYITNEKFIELNCTEIFPGDLIISRLNPPIGRSCIVPDLGSRIVTSVDNVVLRPDTKYRKEYLMYSMCSSKYFEYNSLIARGATMQRISRSLLGDVALPIPGSEEEQTTIASFLDRKTAEIDTLIAQKERLLELYEEEKTAIINHAVTKGIDPNAELKNSGIEWLGEIPVRWEIKKLKYLLDESLKYGANESALLENREHPRYIRITDFGRNGKLREETFKSLPPEIASDYILENGDILFARSGATVGKTFQFKNYDGSACFAGYLIKASPNAELIMSDFLYAFTKSSYYEKWKESILNQATIQNIGADKYAMLDVPLPPNMEQIAIANFLDHKTAEIDAKIAKTQRIIKLQKEYRTALISEVVTGKIKVSHLAEEEVAQ